MISPEEGSGWCPKCDLFSISMKSGKVLVNDTDSIYVQYNHCQNSMCDNWFP